MAPRVIKPLVAAGLCALGLAVIGEAVFGFNAAQGLDVRALTGFMGLGDRSRVMQGADLAQFADPVDFAVMVLALVGVALLRRRPRLALAVFAVPVLAAVSAEALKLLTAAPRGTDVVDPASWPSGHVTSMTALALCLILVAPPRLRPLAAALAWIGTVGIAYSVTITGAHMPSDALAGVLLAGMWTALAVAALRQVGEDAERDTPSLALLAGSFAAVALGGAFVALAAGGAEYAARHEDFALIAVLIAVAAAATTAFTAWWPPSVPAGPPAAR